MDQRPSQSRTARLGLIVFLLAAGYFLWTASVLPKGAGPDYKAQNDGTAFVFDHKRLAVLPDDESLLSFTSHGGTRVLRPPLSYLVSAAVARVFPHATEHERYIAFRKGSALFGAATVALVFYGVTVFLGHAWLGLFGAAAAAFMPQFTFLASYNNDDAAAVFAASLAVVATILIHRRGLSYRRIALLGLATGLSVLAKFSAWLVLPFLWLYVLAVMLRHARGWQWPRYAAIALCAFVIGGGWWIVYNVYHYGVSDPFALKISQQMTDKHRRLPPEAAYGYQARGVGFHALLLNNHDNFLGETFRSTVGNLDWLRLRMGGLQYGLYAAFFAIGMFYYLFRLTAAVTGLLRRCRPGPGFWLETLLVTAILFQLFMYTWTNINNDIQVQGKYLMPALLALWLLSLSGLYRTGSAVAAWMRRRGSEVLVLAPADLGRMSMMVGILLVVVVHLHGLVTYVIPFYDQPPYRVGLGQFRDIDLTTLGPGESSGVRYRVAEDGIHFVTSSGDPWVEFDGGDLCRSLRANDILRLTVTASKRDLFQLFVDQGGGFTERGSIRLTVEAGRHEYFAPLMTTGCRRLRIDPGTGDGHMVIERLAVADLGILPPD